MLFLSLCVSQSPSIQLVALTHLQKHIKIVSLGKAQNLKKIANLH